MGRNHGLGYSLVPLQPDALRRDGLQTSTIVQSVGLGIPQNRIDIEKIMPQQLIDRMRLRSAGHLGVIFRAPQIEKRSTRTKPALYAAESILGENGVADLAPDLVNRGGSENDDVNIGGFRFNLEYALEQQIAKQPTHHKRPPLRREESDEIAEVASGRGALKIAQRIGQDVRRLERAIRPR